MAGQIVLNFRNSINKRTMVHHHKNTHRQKKLPARQPPPPPRTPWFRRTSVRLALVGAGLITASAGYVFYQAHQFDRRLADAVSSKSPYGLFEKVSFMHQLLASEAKFEQNLDAFAAWLSNPSNRVELGKMWEKIKEVQGVITYQPGSFQIKPDAPVSDPRSETIKALEDQANYFVKANSRLQISKIGFVFQIAGSGKTILGLEASPEEIQRIFSTSNVTGVVISSGQSVLLEPPNHIIENTGYVIREMMRQFQMHETPKYDSSRSYIISVLTEDEIRNALNELLPGLSNKSLIRSINTSDFGPDHFAGFHTHYKKPDHSSVSQECEGDLITTRISGPEVVFRMFPEGTCEAVALWKGGFRSLGRFPVHEPGADPVGTR